MSVVAAITLPRTALAVGMHTRTAEESAEAAMRKAIAHPATTRNALLSPDYPVAFDAAEKSIESYKVASGLKMAAWAAEPQLANPVAISIDEKGRLWACETFRFDGGGPGMGVYDIRHMYDRLDEDLASKTVEQRMATLDKWNHNDNSSLTQWPDRLRLIEDRDGDGRADYSSIFAQWSEPLDGLASGVITRRNQNGGDDVYVTNIPHLWLLRDENHDGKADFVKSISYGYGVRYSLLGHDLHGLRWGPDGKLYFSCGDRGIHVVTQEGKTLDYPDEGTVLRCDPDGSNLEVFARGLRNPQKLVFDKYGNLFTGDNNCDYGDPARWVYVVEGGDTGWRIGYQHLQTPKPTGPWLAENLTAMEADSTAAYLVPPLGYIGSGPSGCTYYPGVGLSDKFKDHFFLTNFQAGPSSCIYSFALKPKGASFEVVMDKEHFVDRMVATDVEFGPDSQAYVADWNAGWVKSAKGRIYRVFDPDQIKSAIVMETKKLINDGMTNRAPTELAALLSHQDMRVRQAAQFELAARGLASVSLLQETARKSDNQLARIHAIWGLNQLATKSPESLKSLIPLLQDTDDEIRAQAAKALGNHRVGDSYDPMLKLLADSSARVRFFAAMGVGKIGHPDAVPAIFRMLEASADKDAYLRHAGVMALTWIGDTSQLMAAAKHDSPAVRMAACLALRRLGRSEVALFLKDSQPRIVTEAARAINDAQIEAAQPQLAAMLGSVTLPETVILRALNANLRLGGAENATAVAHFAARGDAPELMRNEALAILAEWDKPRGIDRVVGIWRPFTPATRDPQLAIKAARPVLPGIITSAPDSVRIAAIDLIKKIGLDDANVLFDLVANKEVHPDVAAAALAAMDQRKDARLNEAVDVALKTGKASLRAAAIQMLVHREDATKRLESLLATGSIADQQAVLTALGTIDQPAAEQILSSWMDRLLKEGNVPPEVQLDLLDAAGKSKSDAIKMKVKQYDERRKKDDPVAQYAECLLGGDAAAGRKIFLERQDVSCLRCHKLDGTGGVAGPDLTGVGSRHPRDYFLESIVNPNAKIAPGFESVTAKMKAGKYYTGVVKADTDAELVVDSGDGAVVHLDKKEIATRTKGLSPMPQDISKTLSKRDVRDLVEFLTNLKQPATQPAGTAPQK